MTAWRYLTSSLTGRVFLAFIAPAAIAILCLSIVDDTSAGEALKITDDKSLNILSRMLADNLIEKNGKIELKNSEVFNKISSDRGDKTVFSIQSGGKMIYGHRGITHSPEIDRISRGTAYFDGSFEGRGARVSRFYKKSSDRSGNIVIYVASIPTSKWGARRWMMGTFTINGSVLLLCLIIIVAFSVRWAIAPLSGLKSEIESRPVDEDKPIPLENVPVELRSIVAAFNDLIHKLQDLLAATRRFTADASHQMRTPLSILRTHLELIRQEGIEGPKGLSSLDDVETAANRLQRLLTQLLALARAEDARPGQIAELFGPVDIVEIAKEVAKEHVPDALAAGIEMQFNAPSASIEVRTVDMLVHEMIANLLDNAIRYNACGGWVSLAVHGSESGTEVVIEDNGPGIPPGETERMFDRFTRLPRDRNHKGSGLGLAIVLALAKAIEATVTISARAGGTGTRAVVFFPIKQRGPSANDHDARSDDRSSRQFP